MKVHRFMPTGIALIEGGLIVLALGVPLCLPSSMGCRLGGQGAVAQHGEVVAALQCQRDERLVVALALPDLARVAGA
ncbi:hypothetical protein QMA73_00610 [Burkholderia pseudomallei]|nr:hypothetical protein [Burkholderia pseudomallei]